MDWSMDEAVRYYRSQGAPGDQNALIALLKELQSARGGSIQPADLNQIAQALDAKPALLQALVRRIPSLKLADTHLLELCAGPNCGKAAALAAAAEALARDNPKITLKFVPCMRLCGKGPNLRWDGTLHHKADEALLRRLAGK